MIATVNAMAASQMASYPPDHDYWYTPRLPENVGGVNVNEDTAMTFSTVFACVNKLAKTLATLPAHVYERADGKRKMREDHWLHRLWTVRFSDEVLAINGREALLTNLILWGNAYIECERGRTSGEIVGLTPLYSRYMTVVRNEAGDIEYEYRPNEGAWRVLQRDQVLHVPGLSLNGIVGLSVIGYQRLAIGMGMAATQHGASFFANGAIPGVVLERPTDAPPLEEEGARRVLQGWNEDFMGPANHYRTALLEEGTQAKSVGMPLKDAQFLESRRFQREEICGIFDVPPSKIHDDTRSTFSNVEQKNMDWRTDSLIPWCVRLEQAIGAAFLEDTPFYLKHNLEGLVRGDLVARSTHYQKMIRCGMTVNEWRNLEDMDGIGPDGDVRFISKDLVPLEQAIDPPEPPPAVPFDKSQLQEENGDEQDKQDEQDEEAKRHSALFALAVDASRRIVAKETLAVAKAQKRYGENGAALDAWLDKFYTGQTDFAYHAWLPICEAGAVLYGRATEEVASVAGKHADKYASLSLGTIREIVRTNPSYLGLELSEWKNTKPESLAHDLITNLTAKE